MSLGYAEKLSYRADLGGQVGAPELLEGGALEEDAKVAKLVHLVCTARVRGRRRLRALGSSHARRRDCGGGGSTVHRRAHGRGHIHVRGHP